MRRMLGMEFLILRTPEDTEVKTEHIEGRHGGDSCHNPTHERTVGKAGRQNLILREKTGEGRNTRNGKTGYKEGNMRHGHVFAQAAHGRHLVAVDGMDDAAGTEEEQRLEHGMGEEVEHGGHVTQTTMVLMSGGDFGTYAEGHHHEGYLRNGGEGEHTLDVALSAGHGSGIESGEGADPGHDAEGVGGILYPEGE